MSSEMVLKSQFEQLKQYQPTPEAFDEFFLPDGEIRNHWLKVLNALRDSGDM